MRRLTLALAGILALVALMPAKAQLTVWKNGEALYVMKYDTADSITFSAADALGGEIPDESEAVDLGLPSGTLWAPWNIGAKSATEEPTSHGARPPARPRILPTTISILQMPTIS